MGASRGQSFQAVDEPEAEAQGRRIRHIRGWEAQSGQQVEGKRECGGGEGRWVWLGGGRLGWIPFHCFGGASLLSLRSGDQGTGGLGGLIPEWWPGGGETCMDAGRVWACQWKGCGGKQRISSGPEGFGLSCGGCDWKRGS